MLQKALSDIGFAEKEIAVYVALLEFGPQPVSVIARKANLNRSTAYVVLDNLLKRGVISRFSRVDVQHYSASNPENLLDYVERSKQNLERSHREIEDLLPHMKSLSNPYTLRPRVGYFEGPEGVKQVMEDTLTANGSLLCYSALDKWLLGPLADFIKDYGHRRVSEKKISLRGLVYGSAIAKTYLEKEYSNELTENRWLPKWAKIFDNEINIYDDKIAIVSLASKEMFGVIIENKAISDTQKQIFELAWAGAKK